MTMASDFQNRYETLFMKDNFKRFLTFSKSERTAIVTILTIVVMLLITKYLLVKNPPKRTVYFHNLDSIINSQQRQIDSLLTLDSIKKAERKASYKKSKNSSNQNTQKSKNRVFREPKLKDSIHYQSFKEKTIPIIDINTADTMLLKELPGIGSSFAKRIVEYRNRLGGYIKTEQLLEVYGMDTTRFGNIENYVIVNSIFEPNKLRINYDSFKVLNRHPYLEYEDVKKIVNYREQKGLITSWEQLTEIVGDDIEPKLKEYAEFQ